MLYINNTESDPYYNHALEEYFLKETDEECFILWRNAPCILLGKNQNAYSEINMAYVKEHSLPVVRRISGGGAVFNDLGNINFGFIANGKGDLFASFERFTQPVIQALKKLGVQANLSGRNDIIVDGKKISGNAQARYKNRILHHGTLLFSTDMTDLSAALRVSVLKLQGKGVQSVSARVSNISSHLCKPMNVIEFKNYLMNEVMCSDLQQSQLRCSSDDFAVSTGNSEGACQYLLSQVDQSKIKQLAQEKYQTKLWNFGDKHEYSFTSQKKFLGGIVEANLNVRQNIISDMRIYGDFFGQADIKFLENALVGVNLDRTDLTAKLAKIDIEIFMSNITTENLLEVLLV